MKRPLMKRPLIALARRLAARYGMEVSYPPAEDPPQEARSTLAADGRPCSPWPAEPERIARFLP